MAAEVIGLVIEIVKPLVNPVWRQIDYFWHYKDHVAKLKVDIEETLKDEKVNLDHNVDNAIRKGNKIEDGVGRWVNNANELIKDADAFLRNDEKKGSEKKKSRVIFCSNWMKRHQHGRRAKKMSEKVAELIKEKREKFDSKSISYREGPKGIASLKDYEVFESRASIFEDIMRALRNPDVTKIGVYGINGVGKTTLVKKIAMQAMEEQLINEVAMATAFQDQNMKEMDGEEAAKPDLRRIQGEIKDWLEFEFQKETEIGRAEELRERLTKDNKKIRRLVILDNIWEGLKLDEIGIPDDREECKILMTSTDDNVLRNEMGSTNNFQLDVLQPWEAREWFSKMVGDVVKDPSFEQVAHEVADKCARLPILLFTVANVLKDKKDLSAWKNALIQLSSYDKEEMHHHVHLALRLSYRFLRGEAIKKLFLLCGQLPPNDISVNYLLRYSKGLGLFKTCKTIADTRDRLLALVANLKASSLLLEGNKQGVLRMHDIVRNFAMSVESKNVFTVASGNELRQWPEKVDLEQYTAISLPYCKIPELPDEFECRNLKSFVLFSKDPSVKIPDNFFRRMRKLKVLHLRNIHFLSSLPSSLHFLTKLRTLCFDECKLDGVANLALICKLKNLEILSFRGSDIVQLPMEIAQLSHLLVLDLSDCRGLKVIPQSLLLGLDQLEDLHMENLCLNWEVEGKENKLNELASLSSLSTLDVHITNPMILPMDLFSNKLERFKILIGNGWDWSGEYKTSRTLKLKLNRGVLSKKGVQVLLKKAEELYLDELEDIQTSLHEIDVHGFPQLKHLHIENGHDIQYINSVKRVSSAAFTRLESLYLDKLKNLKKISHGAFNAESFGNLRMLKVKNCDTLKILFSTSMIRSLKHLEELKVSGCKILEEIATEESGDDTDRIETVNLPQLHKLTLKSLPQFTSFWSKQKEIECDNIAEERTHIPLFSETVLCSNLKELKLSSINIEYIWLDQLPGTPTSFQNLTEVNVNECNNLKYLLSFSMLEVLVNLKILKIAKCRMMEEVIVTGGFQEQIELQHLEELELDNLPKIAGFCICNLLKCPALRSLWIFDCPKLATFVSNNGKNKAVNSEAEMAGSVLFDEKVAFPNLEDLYIFNMARLKRIWHKDLYEDSFCKLNWLHISNNKELLTIFPSSYMPSRFQNLMYLFVGDCESLEEVFDAQPLINVKEKNAMSVTKLRYLYLDSLPNLRRVWTKEALEFLSFENIRTLQTSQCPNLESLFPVSLAKGLMQLSRLVVIDCGVKEIVSMEEGEEAMDAVEKFQFPQLNSLRLKKLPELREFFSGRHTIECLALETLWVEDCDKIDIFASEQTPVQQPLFKLEEVMPNLVELPLSSKNVTMIQNGQFSESLFHKVKSLQLQCFHDKSASFPLDLIERFGHLENLTLRDSCFAEVFSCTGNVQEGRNLPQIKKLRLDSLYNLKHIQLDTVTEYLKNLEIWHCNSLTNLAPSSASFRNLKDLSVHKCEGLIHLVTFSTVRNLGQLTTLSITKCGMMTEIVANYGEVEEDVVIVFHKLEDLTLTGLTSLTSFCSASCALEFPSLEEVSVMQCPNMQFFSQADITTPKLRRVITGTDKKVPHQNLNATIKLLYTDLVGFNGMKIFKLSEFPELERRWPDRLPVDFFYNSRSLVVDKHTSCRHAIPSDLLPFLNNLEELEIRKCVSVEKVFDASKLNANDEVEHLAKLNKFRLIDLPKLSHVWISNAGGVFVFRNLKKLTVQNCSSLRHVFTPAIVLGLVKLQELEIKSCQLIEEIISKGAAQEAVTCKLTLPQLDSIILESLPKLECFFSGSGIVDCPLVKKIAVVDCPSTFTSMFLQGQEISALGEINEQKVAFPNLEILRVEWNDTMEEFWHGQFRGEFFCQLKAFELINFPNDDATLPSRFLQRLPSLENLVLTYAEEIVIHKETKYKEHQLGPLPHLKELKLSKLPKVALLSNEDLESSLVFQNLETLEVSECCKLRTLAPSSVLFCHLQVLEVSKCHALINLMPTSVAKSLVQLTRLSVTECEMVEEVIAEENDSNNEVVLEKLRCLRLHCLASLTSFYSGNSEFIFPSLEELEVRECPKMEISSWGSISMPKLNKVQLTEGEDRVYSEGNLNASVLKLFMEMGQAAKSMPSSPRQSTSVPETSQVEKNNMIADPDGKALENMQFSEIPDLGKDHRGKFESPIKVSIEELASKNTSIEPETTTIAQPSKGLHAISSDKENFSQNLKPPIILHNGTYITQNDTQEIAKVQVTLASSVQQSFTFPGLQPSTVEQISQPSYASSNERTSSSGLGHEENFRSNSETPSLSIVDRSSCSPVNFESLFSKAEDLRIPGSQSLPRSLGSVPDAEFDRSIDEIPETYDSSLDLFKKILKKALTEVATSADVFLLLSSLETLKNHPQLNPDQLDIIQDYVENFDSLVTFHPFYKQQINRSSEIKSAIEDNRNGIAELKTLYGEFISKESALTAEKKALKDRLREIEEEEGYIQANMDTLFSNLLTKMENLETNTNALPVAVRQQRVAEDKVSRADQSWDKLRSLFP